MNPSKKADSPNDHDEFAAPHPSPSGCEYYIMTRINSESSPGAPRYEIIVLSVHPRFQMGAAALDVLDRHQVAVIARLLKERNDGRAGDGQWILSGLSVAEGADSLSFMLSFCRYGEFVGSGGVDRVAGEAVSRGGDEALADTTIMTAGPAEKLVSQADFASGSHNPTTSSQLDSRHASTLVPTVVLSTSSAPEKIEMEAQVKLLDELEEVTCKLFNTHKTSEQVSLLTGILDARKLLMGEGHLQTFKTMVNLIDLHKKARAWLTGSVKLLREAESGLSQMLEASFRRANPDAVTP
ncbi:hypothetical protein RUND412_001870 [Rhizina undulata]